MNRYESVKQKPTKGHRGYLKHRKTVLLLRSVLLFLMIAAILLAGYFITGTMKNLFSVLAAVAAIPFAMQLATYFSVLPYRALDPDLYENAVRIVKNAVFDTELLVANKDGASYPILFAYFCESGVYLYDAGKKTNPGTLSEYIRNFLRLNDADMPVYVETDFDRYLKKLEGLPASDRETAPDALLRSEGVLRAISM